MVAAYTTIGLIRAQIEGKISALTPNSYLPFPFTIRPEEDRRSSIFGAGVPRLVQVGTPVFTEDHNLFFIGTNQRVPSVVFPIDILYPTTDTTWRDAAVDDGDLIRSTILNDRTDEPAGLERQEILGIQTFEPNPEDDWEVLTLSLRSILSIT